MNSGGIGMAGSLTDVYKRQAQGRVETMLPHMMEVAGVTEELKACHPMRWVGLMNTLTAQMCIRDSPVIFLLQDMGQG